MRFIINITRKPLCAGEGSQGVLGHWALPPSGGGRRRGRAVGAPWALWRLRRQGIRNVRSRWERCWRRPCSSGCSGLRRSPACPGRRLRCMLCRIEHADGELPRHLQHHFSIWQRTSDCSF